MERVWRIPPNTAETFLPRADSPHTYPPLTNPLTPTPSAHTDGTSHPTHPSTHKKSLASFSCRPTQTCVCGTLMQTTANARVARAVGQPSQAHGFSGTSPASYPRGRKAPLQAHLNLVHHLNQLLHPFVCGFCITSATSAAAAWARSRGCRLWFWCRTSNRRWW